MMAVRKLSHFLDLKKIGFYIFIMESFENGNLRMIADDGFPDNFRAELNFIDVQYISCPTAFVEMFLCEETSKKHPLAHKYPKSTLFCFEEGPPYLPKKAESYIIVAQKIEITIHSDEETLNRMAHLLDPL